MHFGAIKTIGGYAMSEVTSAFQKAIRRGNEEDALFWLYELVRSGEYGYSGYAWKRLKLIASEDIGPAEPTLPATLHALFRSWEEVAKDTKAKQKEAEKKGKTWDKQSETLFLIHATMLCCRAKKSRIANDAFLLFWLGDRQGELRRDIPDYALDQHTGRGRRAGRGMQHFLDEASLINNEAFPNPYLERVAKLMLDRERADKGTGEKLPGLEDDE